MRRIGRERESLRPRLQCGLSLERALSQFLKLELTKRWNAIAPSVNGRGLDLECVG